MSIATMTIDDVGYQLDKRSSSQMDTGGRQLTKIGGKNKLLRLDSLTTIEACNELGIRVEDLKQKTIEDFKDPLVEEEIIQLRFSRYMKRYNQFMKDVLSRKRKIVRSQQKDQIQQQLYDQFRPTPSMRDGRSSGLLPGSTHHLNSTYSPAGLKTSKSVINTTMSSPMWMNYNKAMSYFRNSHDTSEVKNLTAIVGQNDSNNLDETLEKFDTALANEVLRFNRIKRQKQKQAKDSFADEMRRLKIMEEMKEKERRAQEREKKQALEKKKADKEKKRIEDEKLEKVREAERKYKSEKAEEKEKLQKRLANAQEKFEQEVEEKKRIIAERDAKLNEKIKTAGETRSRFAQESELRRTQLNFDISQRLNQSQDLHNTTLFDRMSKAQMQVQRIEDQVVKIKSKQVQESEEYVQKLVEKLATREESMQAFKAKQQKDFKRKEKELAAKNQRVLSQQSDISLKYKERMKEINDRFQKVQDNLQIKREQDEKSLRIRQETTKLKIMEKQENCKIQERQTLYERQKILDKQKYNEEKLVWLRNQREIMQKAKQEATIQSKIEKERIEDAFQGLVKVTFEKGNTSTLNKDQKKILRDILKPEDYQEMEAEERRQEKERKEAEEKRKAEAQA